MLLTLIKSNNKLVGIMANLQEARVEITIIKVSKMMAV